MTPRPTRGATVWTPWCAMVARLSRTQGALPAARTRSFRCAARKLVANLGIDPEAPDLASLPLIASDIVAPSSLIWGTWALAAGPGSGIGRSSDRCPLRFNHYGDTIEAALRGHGVALGWSMLLANPVREGPLVRLGQTAMSTQEHYRLFVVPSLENRSAVQALTTWMAAELLR